MTLENLADLAQNEPQGASATPVKPVAETRYSTTELYTLNGVGLWRVCLDTGGVKMTRKFSTEEVVLTLAAWRDAVGSGRIRQVG